MTLQVGYALHLNRKNGLKVTICDLKSHDWKCLRSQIVILNAATGALRSQFVISNRYRNPTTGGDVTRHNPLRHTMPNSQSLIPVERIERSILLIRGQKVMLSHDLASLYGVETKRL